MTSFHDRVMFCIETLSRVEPRTPTGVGARTGSYSGLPLSVRSVGNKESWQGGPFNRLDPRDVCWSERRLGVNEEQQTCACS